MATREQVWLVDLMALRGGPGLAHALPVLLRAPAAVKLGCCLASDLAILVRSGSVSVHACDCADQASLAQAIVSLCCDVQTLASTG